jgi:hypothetical protein
MGISGLAILKSHVYYQHGVILTTSNVYIPLGQGRPPYNACLIMSVTDLEIGTNWIIPSDKIPNNSEGRKTVINQILETYPYQTYFI